MGCDIHVCFEQEIDGKWTNIDEYEKNEYYTEGNDDGESEFWRTDIYNGRDYHLFAALADIRNYNGYITCMCEPKDFPDDADQKTRDDYESWSSDAHSASHHTLYDMIQFDKTVDAPKGTIVMTHEDGDEEKGYYEPTGDLEFMIKAIYKCLDEMDVTITPEIQKQYRIVFWFDN